jgi:Mn2+/Fe2+ NRAMP family transporter
VAEGLRWPVGLARQPWEARAFYCILGVATLLGISLNFTPIDPIKALYWSAVINGVVAVPVMVIVMIMTSRRDIMGEFTIGGWLRILGWLSTFAMTACVFGMAITWFG